MRSGRFTEFILEICLLQSHFDFHGEGFLKISNKDPDFLIEYVNSLYKENRNRSASLPLNLNFIWELECIEKKLIKAIDLVIEKSPNFDIHYRFFNAFFRKLNEKQGLKADRFLRDYYISCNQDIDAFSKIEWIGNGGAHWGDVVIGDLVASDWRKMLSIIEKSDVGIKLIPIKKYIHDTIESCLKSADWERKVKFLDKY